MSDPEYSESMTEGYAISLWETATGDFIAGVSGEAFLFGITCSSTTRGVHIGPFFIGWVAC